MAIAYMASVREHYAAEEPEVQSGSSVSRCPLGKWAWRDYLEVAAVERGDFMQIEPFGKGDDAGIDRLEPQRGIGGEQLSHPPVIMRRRLDDPQLVVSYGGAEFRSQSGTPAPLRIGEQMADLGDRQ